MRLFVFLPTLGVVGNYDFYNTYLVYQIQLNTTVIYDLIFTKTI